MTFKDFLIDFQDFQGLFWGPDRFPGLFQDFQDFQDSVRTLNLYHLQRPVKHTQHTIAGIHLIAQATTRCSPFNPLFLQKKTE